MGQGVYHVNCPHCGEVIEAVCPDIDKIVKRVKASAGWTFNQANTTNTINCPICHNTIWLYWYY